MVLYKIFFFFHTHSRVDQNEINLRVREMSRFKMVSSRLCCWRRQWHPTPVLLPGKSHGRRSLEGCSPWGRWGSDTTEWLHFHFSLSCTGEGNHSSVLAWRIPGTGEPGGLPSMGSHRVRHDWSDLAAAAADFAVRLLLLAKMSSLSHFISENWLNPKHVFWMPLTLLPIPWASPPQC